MFGNTTFGKINAYVVTGLAYFVGILVNVNIKVTEIKANNNRLGQKVFLKVFHTQVLIDFLSNYPVLLKNMSILDKYCTIELDETNADK